MTSNSANVEKNHRKPFFQRVISNITGKTKKERIAREEKELQAKQTAVKEQLQAALSKMQSSLDEFTPDFEAKSINELEKKMHAPRPENKSPQELRYERWKKRQEEKDRKKAESDRITELFVQAKINGNKKDINKYSKQLAELADIPKTREELEKDLEQFRDDRHLFLKGVMGLSDEEARKFYNDKILAMI